MILSAKEIRRSVEAGEICIHPFDEKFLKAASYSFTLGAKMRTLTASEINSNDKKITFDEHDIPEGGYLLKPGEFIICHTAETVSLGEKVACFLSMRGIKAQMGLDALQCEIFCEPGSEGGWDGKLMLETSNRGPSPVRIFPGITIVKAIFIRVA